MSQRPGRLMLLVFFASTLSNACGDAPTQPEVATDGAPPMLALTPDAAAGFASALEDARLRIVPALGDAPAAAVVRQALDDLSAALGSSQRVALARALDSGDRALSALSGTDDEGAAALAADLDAVRLILTAVGPLLDPGIESSAR